MTMKTVMGAAALAAALLTVPLTAQDKMVTHQVHFKKGTNGATMKESVKGYDTVQYTLAAKVGQKMHVSIESKHANFNIYAPGKGMGDQALFVGEPTIPYDAVLPQDGTYTIAVYLMRNEARRGTKAPFTLHVSID